MNLYQDGEIASENKQSKQVELKKDLLLLKRVFSNYFLMFHDIRKNCKCVFVDDC